MRILEEAVQTAEVASNDVALSVAKYGLAGALLYRDAAADRHRGLELMVQARDFWLRQQICLQMVPNTELWVAREEATRGDRDAAIAMMRKAVDSMHRTGRLAHAIWGTSLLVETLLERGTEGDLAETQKTIDRLANLPGDEGSAMLEITLLRLRALLARAHGDETALPRLRDRYRDDGDIAGIRGAHGVGRGRCHEAGRQLRRSVARNPENPDPRWSFGSGTVGQDRPLRSSCRYRRSSRHARPTPPGRPAAANSD